MTNCEKFKQIFDLTATELWAKNEEDFLTWINSEYHQPSTCRNCGKSYFDTPERRWDDFFGYYYFTTTCPYCNTINETGCSWR